MLRLLSAEFGRCGALRRYQHPQFGVLVIVTMYGPDGSADVVNITPVAQFIRQRDASELRRGPSRSRGRKPSGCKRAKGR